ncbi:MAG: hypothetical protein GXP49_14820 [Deltaproteobacteria bacterium]|nr:hypothetical protein [Deltaproteobacteria bacterium]
MKKIRLFRPVALFLCLFLMALSCKHEKVVQTEKATKPKNNAKISALLKAGVEKWDTVEARYKKLNYNDLGTEPHILGLTMHKMDIRTPEGTPFSVRVGEESGLVSSHEWRATFEKGAEKRINAFIPRIMAAVFGNLKGYLANASVIVRQVMKEQGKDACVAAKLGPWQVIAIYKSSGPAGYHELSLLFGDERAKLKGSSKLYKMLSARAMRCHGLKLQGKAKATKEQ